MKSIFIAILCIASLQSFAQKTNSSNPWNSGRPDGHAPISVMADHTHHKGEFMFSYRFMTMDMKQLKEEDNTISNSESFARYMITPQSMTMNMHMLGAMYAPTNKITLMVMANYIENDMLLKTRTNANFSTASGGFGDVSVSALYSIFNKNRKALHAQVGVSIPTGSIEEKDQTPMSMGNDIQLPYPMQVGSGSFGTKLGLTYLWQNEFLSLGHQLNGLININDNDQDYTFGNRYSFNNWLGAKATENLSFSLRLEGVIIDEISGESDLLNPMMVTTADTNNSGGIFIKTGIGTNIYISKGHLKGLRFGAECALPVYQKVNGIQLSQNYNITFGVQYAFH